MRALIIFIFLFSNHVIAQHLSCCKTEVDVRKFINGQWSDSISGEERIIQFNFSDVIGDTSIYRIDENNDKKLIDNSVCKVKITCKDGKFQIAYDWAPGLISFTTINRLDDKFLVLARNDGKESVFAKLVD
jgi:hypothetical protein